MPAVVPLGERQYEEETDEVGRSRRQRGASRKTPVTDARGRTRAGSRWAGSRRGQDEKSERVCGGEGAETHGPSVEYR